MTVSIGTGVSRGTFVSIGTGVSEETNTPLPPTGLLRMAAVNNTVNNATQTVAGKNRCYIRIPYMIGSGDLSEIRLSHYGYNMTLAGIVSNTNSFNITLSALANSAGTISVPVQYSAGRPLTVAGNAHDVQMDSVLPSAFGLTEFARGDVYWLKMQVDFVTGGQLPIASSFTTYAVSGTQYLWVDSAASSATVGTGVDNPGPFSITGAAATSVNTGYFPVMLGKFVSGDPDTWYGAGDSDLNGVGDDVVLAPWGRGFFSRALYADGTPSRVLAGFNCARSSGYITNYKTLTNIARWAVYCKKAVEECGLNDLGATTGTALSTAAFLGQCKNAWSIFRSQGVEKVLRTWMLGRLQSSDSFATEAGQTFVGTAGDQSWGPAAAALNAAFQAEVGITLDVLVPMYSCRGSVDTSKWRANGTATYATFDGVHKSPTMHALSAIDLRAYMDAS